MKRHCHRTRPSKGATLLALIMSAVTPAATTAVSIALTGTAQAGEKSEAPANPCAPKKKQAANPCAPSNPCAPRKKPAKPSAPRNPCAPKSESRK